MRNYLFWEVSLLKFAWSRTLALWNAWKKDMRFWLISTAYAVVAVAILHGMTSAADPVEIAFITLGLLLMSFPASFIWQLFTAPYKLWREADSRVYVLERENARRAELEHQQWLGPDRRPKLRHALSFLMSRTAIAKHWLTSHENWLASHDEHRATVDPYLQTLQTACIHIGQAAFRGHLELYGRMQDQVQSELIPRETWEFAQLEANVQYRGQPGVNGIIHVKPVTVPVYRESAVFAEKRTERVRAYQHILVNADQFEALWPLDSVEQAYTGQR